tara:strand:+ start:1151 stop:1627 length:477 start_codon:yes stop_codon:yes gene_type:complete
MNQGIDVTTVRCHPDLKLQVLSALEEANIKPITVLYDSTLTGETIVVGGVTIKAATARRAGFDINGPKAEVTTVDVGSGGREAPSVSPAGTLGFICPWCGANVDWAYGGQVGEVKGICSDCDQPVMLYYEVRATASRDASDEVLKAFKLGFKLGGEKK